MKLLEICAGSAELSLYAKSKGVKTTALDIKQYGNIDVIMDAEDITLGMILENDVAWFGTPCTPYSVMTGVHRNVKTKKPTSPLGVKCDRMNTKIINLFKEAELINPKFIWYIENPRGQLRKMDFMRGLNRVTITYCSYSDIRMKPTDIWSNNHWDMYNLNGWKKRGMCWNGNRKCQHEPAPRGSKTGTQGLKNKHERSKMPKELIEDVINQTILKFNSLKK